MGTPLTADPIDHRPPLTRWQWVALVLLLLGGLFLRAYKLSGAPLWVDEAESSINALTIQQHGVPTSSYMGKPIFENMLTKPAPADDPEYEFLDSSYSDRGVAIYHGWLPLYSIAISERLCGVTPDQPSDHVRHDEREVVRRVIAARLPAVVYGVMFLGLLFVTARRMYGADAGFAALVFGGVADPFVLAARQARYYSATLAISVLCVFLSWRIFKLGRRRDYVFGGLAFGLLFHTHVLSFMILCVAFLLLLPDVLRRGRRGIVGLAVMGTIVFAMTVPWLIATGFLRAASGIPPARALLTFPADLLSYPLDRLDFTLVAVLSAMWIAAFAILRERMPERFRKPVEGHVMLFVYLIAWGVIGLTLFATLVPAASYFLKRLSLTVMGPGVLLLAVFVAAAARLLGERRAIWVAPLAAAAMLPVTRMMPRNWPYDPFGQSAQQELLDYLRHADLPAGTRLYATPNDQLTLQYLTGMPFQSVASIRKSFIDRWPGWVVIVEPVARYLPLRKETVLEVASNAGVTLTDAQAEFWTEQLKYAAVAEDAQRFAAEVRPPPPTNLPHFAVRLIAEQRWMTDYLIQRGHNPTRENPAVFRGQTLHNWSEWWPVFFYRFVDWPSRSGTHLNYYDRARTSKADVLPRSGWVVYWCPPLVSRPPVDTIAPAATSRGATEPPASTSEPATR